MSRTVLVIERDAVLRHALCDSLEARGFGVWDEASGDRGLAALRTRRPSAIVTGLLLPGTSGFSVLEEAARMRSEGPLPAIAITGTFIHARNRRDAIERYGLVDVLPKPIDPDQVAEMLKDQLERNGGPATSKRGPSRRGRTLSSNGGPSGQPAQARANGGGRSGSAPRDQAAARDGSQTGKRPAQRGSGLFSRFFAADTDTGTWREETSGDLARVLIGRLLRDLAEAGAEGILQLKGGRKRKDVYLEAGAPIHVVTNLAAERLGRVLVRLGIVGRGGCDEALERQRGRGERIGSILIEMGALTPQGLQRGLDDQLKTALLELFTWDGGTFRFLPEPGRPPARALLDTPLPRLIAEGVIQRMPRGRVRREIDAISSSYPVWGSVPRLREQDLGLGPDAEDLFAQLDGARPVAAVLEADSRARATMERLLLVFLCTGKVELQRQRDERHTAQIADPGLE